MQGSSGGWVKSVVFKDQNGNSLYKIEQKPDSSKNYVLDPDEEIIGLFGCYGSEVIDSFGLIVWKPPKL